MHIIAVATLACGPSNQDWQLRGFVTLADKLGRGKSTSECRSLHPSLPDLYKDVNSKHMIIQDSARGAFKSRKEYCYWLWYWDPAWTILSSSRPLPMSNVPSWCVWVFPCIRDPFQSCSREFHFYIRHRSGKSPSWYSGRRAFSSTWANLWFLVGAQEVAIAASNLVLPHVPIYPTLL